MGLSFGAVISRFSAARRSLFAANYHRAVPGANVSRPVWFANSTGLLAEVRLVPRFHVEMEMILVRLVGVRAEHRAEMAACVLEQKRDEFALGIGHGVRCDRRRRGRIVGFGLSPSECILAAVAGLGIDEGV